MKFSIVNGALLMVVMAASPTTTTGATIFMACTASAIPNLTDQAPAATAAITCPQFNSANGVLVQYGLYTGIIGTQTLPTGTITLVNPNSTTLVGAVDVNYRWTGSTFAGVAINASGVDLLTPVNISGNGSQTNNIRPNFPVSLSTGGQTLALASLIGTGTIHVADITATTQSGGGAGATLGLPISWNINAPVDGITIVYTYQVPEPSTATLAAASGLLVLAALRFGKRA